MFSISYGISNSKLPSNIIQQCFALHRINFGVFGNGVVTVVGFEVGMVSVECEVGVDVECDVMLGVECGVMVVVCDIVDDVITDVVCVAEVVVVDCRVVPL